MAIQQMTSEEYEKKYGVRPFSTSTIKPEEVSSEGNFLTGLAKSGLSTVKGTLQLGEKLGGSAIIKGIDKLTGNKNKAPLPSESKFLSEESIKTRGTGEKIGKFVGDVAQFAIPGTKVGKATQALSTIPRIATRALTSGAIGVAQTGDLKGGLIAAGTEAIAPGVAKVAKAPIALMGRLFKGVGSALSGASSSQINAILNDPQAARQAVGAIKKSGGASLLRKNAQEIVQGVSKIRQEARGAFKEGLEQLSETDINPATFRETIGATLNKFMVQKPPFIVKGVKVLNNVEFDDPKNLKKASDLIDRLSKADLNGKSLRKLADDIEESKFKTATSDERLAFNAFLKDLSGALKESVSKSTNKLDEINKAFSRDIQLTEEVEKIFGKVKFKSAKEVLGVSQKLENLFNQKGLAPEAVDRFLQKVGVSPTGFKASEATRQVGELAPTGNTIGTNPFEIVRAFTAAIVSPKAVRSLAIATGMAEDVIKEVATKLSPTARATFVRTILGERLSKENESPDQTIK